MTAYADVETFRTTAAWALTELPLPGTGTDDDLAGLLERSSRDIDSYLQWPYDDAVTPPLRIPAETLSVWETWVLQQACISQAVYRLELDESTLVEGASLISNTGSVSFSPRSPDLVGSQALLVLSGCESLFRYRTGLALPVPDPDPEPSGDGR